ncbi:DUF4280 domain-containing protein [Piscinibacter sakaiensis]|uniref:DUF4280 domain-containing protein n=1 Tax=Piscinibacter sakaiensis TaxID=1547922 RepID=UPI003AAE4171
MPNHVCHGAMLKCSMGIGPSTLMVLPDKQCLTSFMPAANIMDHKPFINIMPFPLCNAKLNPTVIAATAAALGTPTPAACVPNTPAPWAAGSPTVILKFMPALNKSSKLMCAWGGVIEIAIEGQMTEAIP